MKKRIETDRKRIISSLTGKKARIENLIGTDLKNVDMVALNKEEDRLRNSERLVRVPVEEFEKLSSEQQAIVRQAQVDHANITKRLKEIKEVKSFFKIVENRRPEDVLKDIDDMIKDVSENYSFENIDKLNMYSKKTDKDSKDGKKDGKDNKDSKDGQGDKDSREQNDIDQLKGKLENNEKDIEKYKIKMEKYKNDPQKRKTYESCKRMVEELETENEEIRRKLNIKGPDKKDDKTKAADDKDKKDDKAKAADDKDKKDDKAKAADDKDKKDDKAKTADDKDKKDDKTKAADDKDKKDNPEFLKRKFEDNLRKMSQYADLLNRYKDDPVTTKNIMDAINKLKEENEKIYNTLNMTKDTKRNIQPVDPKNKQSKKGEIELPKIETEKRPTILFDIATGKYTYTNEKGKAFIYDFFSEESDKNNDGGIKDKITKKQERIMHKKAMEHGLTKQQAKKIDVRVYKILARENKKLLANYINSLKGEKGLDKGFDLTYDLRKRNREIKNFIGYINQARISNVAKKQEKLGIATVYKDKSRALAYGLFSTLGIAAALGVTKGPDLLNKGNEPKINGNQWEWENNQDKDKKDEPKINGNQWEWENNQDKNENTEKNEGQEQAQNENEFGYVKVAQGAMLYRDPTDELRIMNGINANEKVTIKQTSGDKLYKVTKIGYYAVTGEYVAVEAGETLEDALAKKGLDMSFIQNDNSVKMYHIVAEGIAEWVHADDIEFIKVKIDKFGNRVDKTDEEKKVDKAVEEYYSSLEGQGIGRDR